MLYEEPTPTASKNLSARDIPMYSRPINTCHGHGGVNVFISSTCIPEAGKPGSLQAYRTICHRIVESYDPWTGDRDGPFAAGTAEYPTYRDGHCRNDEICVNGLGPEKSRSGHRVASCVSTEYFVQMIEFGTHGNTNKSRVRTAELQGRMMSMVFSEVDGNTPLEADTLSAKAIFASDHLGSDGEGAAFHDSLPAKCRDCMELETQQFEKGTEGLKTTAKLLTTGGAAGILWLALVSG